MYDLVVRGGTIVDGTGAAPFVGDVAIQGGKIASVGKVSEKGRQEIDARGKLVTPGLRRHPHPLRRPGDLGPAADAFGVARRDDRRDGQLRRRLRTRRARASTTS